MSVSTLLARALYDNVAECPDELSFRRGEILMVVECDMAKLGGWWLCSLHGRRGIVPGNRLKLLQGARPLPSAQETVCQVPPSLEGSEVDRLPPSLEGSEVYQVPPSLEGSEVYQVPPSLEGSEVYQVPPSLEGSEVYQVPPLLEGSEVDRVPPSLQRSEVYRVPPSLERSEVDRGPPSLEGSEVYQVPPSLERSEVDRAPPSSERSEVERAPPSSERSEVDRCPSLANKRSSEAGSHEGKASEVPDRETESSSDLRLTAEENEYMIPDSEIYKMPTVGGLVESRAVEIQQEVYNTPSLAGWGTERPPLRDIPPTPHHPPDIEGERPTAQQEVYNVPSSILKDLSGDETYNVPSGMARRTAQEPSSEELYDSPRGSGGLATPPPVERLGELRLSVLAASSRLLESVSQGLGGRQWAEAESSGVGVRARGLGRWLSEFLACARAGGLGPGLGPDLEGLEQALGLLAKLSLRVEGWERGEAGSLSGLQDLSQFEAVVGRIVRHTESLASLLLLLLLPLPPTPGSPQAPALPPPPLLALGGTPTRRPLPPLPEPGAKAAIQTRPLPPTPAYSRDQPSNGTNEYEGLHLTEEQQYVQLQGREVPDLCQKEASTNREITDPADNQVGGPRDPPPLPATDRRLIAFYAQQSDAHLATLLSAIEALFACLRASQPPRAFVGHGRHVIVSAHKLVFIGDALSRQALAPGVRAQVGQGGASLCQALRAAVLATKGAALCYPALSPVQEMVDKVTELSHHALRFTRLLAHMSLL